MHQKNNQASQPSSTTLHNDGDDDDDGIDPFADADDDDDVDVDDDDGTGQGDDRGAWWRGVLRKGDADGDSDDDDEFGDFAMAEDDKSGGADKVVLKPLAVNPTKENTRTLSGLWPFGTKKERGGADDGGAGAGSGSGSGELGPQGDVVVSPAEETAGRAIEVKEAKSRTSIEDPDDDDDYGAELLAGTRA
jgi:SIT4-associating protein SAP185/190